MLGGLDGDPTRPPWADDPSPWGPVWSEIVGRPAWYAAFPYEPPFHSASGVRFEMLRSDPNLLPRCLAGDDPSAPDGLVDSELGRLVETSPSDMAVAVEQTGNERVQDAIAELSAKPGATPDTDTIKALVSPAALDHHDEILALATQRTHDTFDRRVHLYAPLYLSNECTNRCAYCGFSLDRAVARATLTNEQLDKEATAVRDLGIHEILLLTGEAPAKLGIRDLVAAVRRVSSVFDTVDLEVFAMDVGGYRRVAEAGVSGLTIYQETYDRQAYFELHRGGRKRKFLWRLGAPERAAAAGLRRLGIGSLLGLNDWRYETLAVVLHARSLQSLLPSIRLSVSFPRLRPMSGVFTPPHPVDDRALAHMMAVVRLAVPSAELVLSTREAAELRDRLASRLATRVSAGAQTRPGGFTSDEAASEQFEIADHRTPAEVTEALQGRGMRIANGC